jgi:hypothetical protein
MTNLLTTPGQLEPRLWECANILRADENLREVLARGGFLVTEDPVENTRND